MVHILLKVELKWVNDEIQAKNEQIDLLEKQTANSFIASNTTDQPGVSQVCLPDIIVTFLYLLAFQLNAGCFVV